MKKMEKPIIENTEMFECIDEATGKLHHYHIYPAEGYKLHTKSRDEVVYDEETMEETGEIKLGYTKGVVTALANYDFEKNVREIYAVKEEE